MSQKSAIRSRVARDHTSAVDAFAGQRNDFSYGRPEPIQVQIRRVDRR
ncbi:MAG: hypothetical protein UU22_C0035G0008 [Parcubacteria group bacterium GW2011_GWA2_40_8]|nr:MAG: hypothetical protein UT82_C0022G0007 [Parcubacteria group bacterium GW2011_GWB1_40_14]KKR77852.1 MAG: hypothetical protein UU22_C0035G0008 [Parcubacteria group bacterium GW2011_GWA2_40_8]